MLIGWYLGFLLSYKNNNNHPNNNNIRVVLSTSPPPPPLLVSFSFTLINQLSTLRGKKKERICL